MVPARYSCQSIIGAQDSAPEPAGRRGLAQQVSVDHQRTGQRAIVQAGPVAAVTVCDFGILKWPTLAVCFGPPLDTANFYSGFERALGSGGWSWTGEPRWSCSSRFCWS